MTHAVINKENKQLVDGDKGEFTAGKEINNTVK
jgi:hypothetical protein